MRCSTRHQEVDPHTGEGLCSVPMWMGGVPAGFCDEPAYGEQTKAGRMRYDGYVPSLACPAHGGPTKEEAANIPIVFRDGNSYCAVRHGFVNLQESPAGFGDTKEQAIAALVQAEGDESPKRSSK